MYAVILASGSGTRQMPLGASIETQALRKMTDGRTLLQHTADRLEPLIAPSEVVVISDRRHGQLVREQLPDARLVPEPRNRGTAASLALATVAIDRPEDEPMVVVCADHEVDQPDVLLHAVEQAGRQLSDDGDTSVRTLLSFGIRPTTPDSEMTYFQPRYDDPLRVGDLRFYGVAGVEPRPDKGRTQQLYESGTSYWSAGIYIWQRRAIASAIERYTPLFTLVRPAYRSEIALRAAYDQLQPVSIEEAVLVGAARDRQLLIAPIDVGWREVTG